MLRFAETKVTKKKFYAAKKTIKIWDINVVYYMLYIIIWDINVGVL